MEFRSKAQGGEVLGGSTHKGRDRTCGLKDTAHSRRYLERQEVSAINTHNARRQADKPLELTCSFDLTDTIESVSPGFAAFYQCKASDLTGCGLDDLGPGDLHRDISESIQRARLLSSDNPVSSREIEGLDHWGRRYWVNWTERVLLSDEGWMRGFELSGRDVTRERMAEEDAAYQASCDPLTGVLNHQAFIHRAEEGIRDAGVRQIPLGILVADISGVVDLVAAGGSGSANRVREEVAERIVATFRATDAVGRIDTDRFAVLCPDLRGGRAVRSLVQRLEYIVGEPMIGLKSLRVRTDCAWVLTHGDDTVDGLFEQLESHLASRTPSRSV